MSTRYKLVPGGRFTQRYPNGVVVYVDARHQITRVPVQGGYVELVKEAAAGGWRNQMVMSVIDGRAIVFEYERE